MPNFSAWLSAYSRHSSRTSQLRQTDFASRGRTHPARGRRGRDRRRGSWRSPASPAPPERRPRTRSSASRVIGEVATGRIPRAGGVDELSASANPLGNDADEITVLLYCSLVDGRARGDFPFAGGGGTRSAPRVPGDCRRARTPRSPSRRAAPPRARPRRHHRRRGRRHRHAREPVAARQHRRRRCRHPPCGRHRAARRLPGAGRLRHRRRQGHARRSGSRPPGSSTPSAPTGREAITGEVKLLTSVYRRSLTVADEVGSRIVAFPADLPTTATASGASHCRRPPRSPSTRSSARRPTSTSCASCATTATRWSLRQAARVAVMAPRLEAVRGDITVETVDAIVNAANPALARGGGVCGAIFAAAGPELDAACAAIGGCDTGDAVATPGFRLPARWIVHAVGPVWHGGDADEPDAPRVRLPPVARGRRRASAPTSIAFPAISTGIYGYPLEAATTVAVRTITTTDTHDRPRPLRLLRRTRRSHELRARARLDTAAARGAVGGAIQLARASVGALVVEEVDEHVVAEGVGRGEERAAAVHAHHALDEAPAGSSSRRA